MEFFFFWLSRQPQLSSSSQSQQPRKHFKHTLYVSSKTVFCLVILTNFIRPKKGTPERKATPFLENIPDDFRDPIKVEKFWKELRCKPKIQIIETVNTLLYLGTIIAKEHGCNYPTPFLFGDPESSKGVHLKEKGKLKVNACFYCRKTKSGMSTFPKFLVRVILSV